MESAFSDLIDRVRAAAAQATPLQIHGGRSKGHLASPASPGEPLDTRGWAGVTSYEPSELVVTARAGTPLAELEAALAEQNQCLPFEPPHFGPGATVGGMVAAGLSGPARASVGAVRDYMLGVSIINGRGEPLTFGGQVMKNVAGYDVSRLMAGSWGTLGVITDVSLKVLPLAPAETTLVFEGSQAEALDRLNAWGGQPLPLNASCWVEDEGSGRLYVRLRGAVAAIEAACRSMGGERKTHAEVAGDWQACREQHLPWFAQRVPQQGLWRLSVPSTTGAIILRGEQLIEWGGAQRWLKVDADSAMAHNIRRTAASVGGHATLFRGGDKHLGVFQPLAPAVARIHQRLKAAFDPSHIFNQGRMY